MPTSRRITIDTGKVRQESRGTWVDPTSGKETPANGRAPDVKGLVEFTPPPMNGAGEADWVLELR